jgi:hypothetical protein
MAKYLSISQNWIHEPVPRIVKTGEVVELAHTKPGSGFYPLDDAARKAVEDARRAAPAGRYLDRAQRRHLANLTRAQRALVERAEREAAAP